MGPQHRRVQGRSRKAEGAGARHAGGSIRGCGDRQSPTNVSALDPARRRPQCVSSRPVDRGAAGARHLALTTKKAVADFSKMSALRTDAQRASGCYSFRMVIVRVACSNEPSMPLTVADVLPVTLG